MVIVIVSRGRVPHLGDDAEHPAEAAGVDI
jgi:hypothetical protein